MERRRLRDLEQQAFSSPDGLERVRACAQIIYWMDDQLLDAISVAMAQGASTEQVLAVWCQDAATGH